MAEQGSFSIDDAWHTVALEERFELLGQAQANGILASVLFFFLMGAAGYGFDQIWVLAAGAVGCTFVMPLFASFSWRKIKPNAILQYLAVRSVARRYAFGNNIKKLDVVLIFRGEMEELYDSEEHKQLALQGKEVDFESPVIGRRDVWVCLMRGALVILSEKLGGARLEFMTPLDETSVCRKPNSKEEADARDLIIEGAGFARGRSILLHSRYPGALYVFDKQFGRLVAEDKYSNEEKQSKPAPQLTMETEDAVGNFLNASVGAAAE